VNSTHWGGGGGAARPSSSREALKAGSGSRHKKRAAAAMSLVTVQLGQCGNQIGAEFFRTLHEEAVAGPPSFRSRTLEVSTPTQSGSCALAN